MSLGHSPQIVMNGMVLCLDAANPKNYNLTEVEVLVVAGGGGGGSHHGGGGGGGGVVYNRNFAVTPGSAVTVTVGGGGSAGTYSPNANGGNGGNSVFSSITATGGGGGGTYSNGGNNGGSGGGANNWSVSATGGSPTSGQGFAGGSNNGQQNYGGGGGGAGGTAKGLSNNSGGDGLPFSISGTQTYYGGGGAAGVYPGYQNDTSYGYGGLGGGGNGGNGPHGSGTGPTVGGTNTGGGGGGVADLYQNGAAGGSGIVIVRYPGPQKAIGGTVTSIAGHTIHTFTTVGSTTFTPLVATNNSAILGLSDFSGNGNFGTTANSPTYSSANGGSVSFDGTNDWLPTSLSIGDANTSFSWGGFVKVNSSTTSNFFLFGNYTENTTTPFFAIAFNNSGDNTFIYIRDSTGGTEISSGSTNLDLNTWYYLIGVRDAGANQVKLYVNGELRDTDTFAGSHNVKSTTNNFGAVRHLTNYANCTIGTIHVYNRALTAAEISQNFQALRGRFGI